MVAGNYCMWFSTTIKTFNQEAIIIKRLVASSKRYGWDVIKIPYISCPTCKDNSRLCNLFTFYDLLRASLIFIPTIENPLLFFQIWQISIVCTKLPYKVHISLALYIVSSHITRYIDKAIYATSVLGSHSICHTSLKNKIFHSFNKFCLGLSIFRKAIIIYNIQVFNVIHGWSICPWSHIIYDQNAFTICFYL